MAHFVMNEAFPSGAWSFHGPVDFVRSHIHFL